MRGTQSIISSGGPTVQLASSTLRTCWSCGKQAEKAGSLRISFAKHQPGFETINDEERPRIHLCLNCAGTIASSTVELLTNVATQTVKQKR